MVGVMTDGLERRTFAAMESQVETFRARITELEREREENEAVIRVLRRQRDQAEMIVHRQDDVIRSLERRLIRCEQERANLMNLMEPIR